MTQSQNLKIKLVDPKGANYRALEKGLIETWDEEYLPLGFEVEGFEIEGHDDGTLTLTIRVR